MHTADAAANAYIAYMLIGSLQYDDVWFSCNESYNLAGEEVRFLEQMLRSVRS